MNIAVFFGGKSCEHNISVITGVQALKALSGHHVVPIYIDNGGVWRSGKELYGLNAYKTGAALKSKAVFIKPYGKTLYNARGKRLLDIDCALLCNHGANGEDGSLQGLLQLSGIPYTGSGVAASGAGMDKVLMKRLFKAAGLTIVKHAAVTQNEFEDDAKACVKRLTKLNYPLIVKPASGGSSIGISMAHDETALLQALKVAFLWDNTAVVEQALTDFIELNCAVLGDGGDAETSEVEQPVGWKEFLTFSDKYEKSKVKGAGGGRKLPADLPEAQRLQVRAEAIKAFRAVGAEGVARVDFMLDNATGKLYVNEINTIPGSLSSYLFSHDGLSYPALLDRLIGLALKRQEERDRLTYLYTSDYKLSKH